MIPYFHGLVLEEEWEKTLCLFIFIGLVVLAAAILITILLCGCLKGEKKVVSSESDVQLQSRTAPGDSSVPPTVVYTPDVAVLGGIRWSTLAQLQRCTFIDPVGRVSSAVARLAGAPVSVLANPAQLTAQYPSTLEGLLGENQFSPWDPFIPQGENVALRLSHAVRESLGHITTESQGEILTSGERGTLCIVADPSFFEMGPSRFGYSPVTPVVPSAYVAANAWARGLHDWLHPLRQPGAILEGVRVRVLVPSPGFESHFVAIWCNCAVFNSPEMMGALEIRCVPELFAEAEPSYSEIVPLRN
ncbi:hypothetical protein ACJZTR_00490 [Neorickettsia risticii]